MNTVNLETKDRDKIKKNKEKKNKITNNKIEWRIKLKSN